MGLERIGNWQQAMSAVEDLGEKMLKAQLIAIKRAGLYAEGQAKKHIKSQDLGWKPLEPKTIANKIRQGYSENILVQTSSYFQSITSWVDENKGIAYAGVKKQVRNKKSGELIADIAKVHEFGSKSGGIPARPLWQPVNKETIAFMKKSENTPPEIFKKLMMGL
nr:MAG TPA: virion morphogenesis protein [Caudoviricetes sp.]